MTDAARSVIGSILQSTAALDDVTEVMAPSDFADARHELIMEAALRVAAQGARPDPVTVGEALGKAGLKRVGGEVELNRYVFDTPITTNAGYHAEIVVKDAARRRMASLADWLHQQIEDGADPIELQDATRSKLDEIPTPGNEESRSFSDSLQDTLQRLEEGHTGYIPTGWPDLDRLIHGWRPGALHVVGARPGQGKSIVGAQTALATAKAGKAAVIASMEMTQHELNMRFLAQTSQVGMDSLAKHALTEMEWGNVSAAVPSLLGASLFVDDRPHQTIAQIRAHARRVAQRADLGLIVVDYMQQVETPAHLRRAPRHEQVGHTARSLKLLAREMEVPVIALAQVNRGSEQRTDRRPTMSDLRESGSIEADADVVMLLHHEDESATDLEVLVRKSRHGRQGDFTLAWQAHFARLMSHSDPYGRQHAS